MEKTQPDVPTLNPSEVLKSQFVQVALTFDSEIVSKPLVIGTGSLFITNEYFVLHKRHRRIIWTAADSKEAQLAKVSMHLRDVVFYGLKQGEKDLQINIQLKGNSLNMIEEDIPLEKQEAKSESEGEGAMVDEYEKQGQVYLKPNLKENG